MRLDHYLKIVLKTHMREMFRATYKNCGARAARFILQKFREEEKNE